MFLASHSLRRNVGRAGDARRSPTPDNGKPFDAGPGLIFDAATGFVEIVVPPARIRGTVYEPIGIESKTRLPNGVSRGLHAQVKSTAAAQRISDLSEARLWGVISRNATSDPRRFKIRALYEWCVTRPEHPITRHFWRWIDNSSKRTILVRSAQALVVNRAKEAHGGTAQGGIEGKIVPL